LPRLDFVTELSHFRGRTSSSGVLFGEFKKHIAGGVTANAKFMYPYPIVMRSAGGSKLVDVDGNEYVDYCLGYGPLILGHGHPTVVNAITNQLEASGTSLYGTPHKLELEMAKRISSLYRPAELVRFTNSGTEATLNALRIAKAYTRREKVAKFEGHYHGWHEYATISVSPELSVAGFQSEPMAVPHGAGVPQRVVDNTIVLPFNDASAVERIIEREAANLAGVIMEPVARGYMIPESGFLRCVREVTEENDIPLIFDEVMTGFRLGLGGAAQYFGIRPDLVALGKIVGGGLPCGVFGGRSDIMSLISLDSDSSTSLFHSGTYNACATVLAAGLATMDVLEQPGVYEQLDRAGERIRGSMTELLAERFVEAKVLGLRSIFHILFTGEEVKSYRQAARADGLKLRSLNLAMCNRGIFFTPLHCCFLSIAHNEEDVTRTLNALADIF